MSCLLQRWNDARSVRAFAWLAAVNVTVATRRWTPMLNRLGVTRAENRLPLRIVLIVLPSRRETTFAIPTPRTRALNALMPTQPFGASSRALTAPIHSPRTTCPGCDPGGVAAGPPGGLIAGGRPRRHRGITSVAHAVVVGVPLVGVGVPRAVVARIDDAVAVSAGR